MTRKIVLLFLGAVSCASIVHAQTINGFDLGNSEIPTSEISHGGPPKDAIPAIDKPAYLAPDEEARRSRERVLALDFGGVRRAYPIRILNWHEIVNDSAGGHHYMVTYCPLCGSGMAFESEPEGFGVSGLLYNSDVLLYDRRTLSLWSQIGMRAISGERKGEVLIPIRLTHTTLAGWLEDQPDSEILSTETGFKRNYEQSPYAGYEKTPNLFFKVKHKAPDFLHPKSLVLGVQIGDVKKAYPYATLDAGGARQFTEQINGKRVVIHWDSDAKSAAIEPALSDPSAVGTQMFWFAWYAFHPQTLVYEAPLPSN
ncbi:MAG: DUF3179 domain-containing protein [Gammaproteobacteria bacterium]